MTEPGAGSDVRSMATRALRDGSDYILNGTKHFISYADKADFVILFAATGVESGSRGERKRISGFLIDKGTPGMEITMGAPTVSHRGYHHCQIVLTDCRVPANQVLGEEGGGFELMGRWLGASRLSVAAACVGRARRVLEASVEWAATRHQFGRPIGQFQGTGFKLADMAIDLDAAELLTLRAAWRHDQGRMTDADVASAKLFASEMLGRITDHAVQIFGGMGLSTAADRAVVAGRAGGIWDGTSGSAAHLAFPAATARPLMAARGRTSHRGSPAGWWPVSDPRGCVACSPPQHRGSRRQVAANVASPARSASPADLAGAPEPLARGPALRARGRGCRRLRIRVRGVPAGRPSMWSAAWRPWAQGVPSAHRGSPRSARTAPAGNSSWSGRPATCR
jgi:hypothetical protein